MISRSLEMDRVSIAHKRREFSDQIYTARREGDSCGFNSKVSYEPVYDHYKLRSIFAANSGITSTVKTPVDCSTDAKYLTRSGALRMG